MNIARQIRFRYDKPFYEREMIMNIVINRRKIRNTVRQIVMEGNRVLRQEIRDCFGKRIVTGGVVAGGFFLREIAGHSVR